MRKERIKIKSLKVEHKNKVPIGPYLSKFLHSKKEELYVEAQTQRPVLLHSFMYSILIIEENKDWLTWHPPYTYIYSSD